MKLVLTLVTLSSERWQDLPLGTFTPEFWQGFWQGIEDIGDTLLTLLTVGLSIVLIWAVKREKINMDRELENSKNRVIYEVAEAAALVAELGPNGKKLSEYIIMDLASTFGETAVGVILESVRVGRMSEEAAQGNPGSQFFLAGMYYSNQDYTQAVMYLQMAAEQGLAEAQFYLANMYYYGEETEQDNAKAVKWYRKAAEQGHPEAQHCPGFIYKDSHGMPVINKCIGTST